MPHVTHDTAHVDQLLLKVHFLNSTIDYKRTGEGFSEQSNNMNTSALLYLSLLGLASSKKGPHIVYIIGSLFLPTGRFLPHGHPQTVTVVSGTMANFTCTVNSCERILTWRIGTYGSENITKISGNNAENETWSLDTCDNHSNRKTARLGIVASSNSVIQCEELKIISGLKEKTYSKFAMLIVEPQHEGVSRSQYILQHFLPLYHGMQVL